MEEHTGGRSSRYRRLVVLVPERGPSSKSGLVRALRAKPPGGRAAVRPGIRPEREERLVREFVLQLKMGRIEQAYFRDKFGVQAGPPVCRAALTIRSRGMARGRRRRRSHSRQSGVFASRSDHPEFLFARTSWSAVQLTRLHGARCDHATRQPVEPVRRGGHREVARPGRRSPRSSRHDGHRCLVLERAHVSPLPHRGVVDPTHLFGPRSPGPAAQAEGLGLSRQVQRAVRRPFGRGIRPVLFLGDHRRRPRAHLAGRALRVRPDVPRQRPRQGVEVQSATTVIEVLFDKERAVGVRARRADGRIVEIAARVVADASGRATVIGHQLGLRSPIPGLAKASCWSYYKGGRRAAGIDAGETTMFMIPGRRLVLVHPAARRHRQRRHRGRRRSTCSPGRTTSTPVFLREVASCAPLVRTAGLGSARRLRFVACRISPT